MAIYDNYNTKCNMELRQILLKLLLNSLGKMEMEAGSLHTRRMVILPHLLAHCPSLAIMGNFMSGLPWSCSALENLGEHAQSVCEYLP